MRTLPAVLPSAQDSNSSVAAPANPSGYDFLIGGHGFRLATNDQNPYQRYTEKINLANPNSPLTASEAVLTSLPWISGQSSFHGGAGQLNLEIGGGYSPYAYAKAHMAHWRFWNSQGVDVWTLGQLTRLPDTTITGPGFIASDMTTAAADGADYAILGGASSKLCQISWPNGVDSAATVTAIDLTSTPGDVLSVVTDGVNYYALISGSTSYVVSGSAG